MAEAINEIFPASTMALDSAAVKVAIPEIYEGREVDFISSIGAINVNPDTPARVVINERTGVIVATAEVRVSTVAISHGALTISISNDLNVSQPNGFGDAGDTVVTPATETDVTEMSGGFKIVNEFPTIQQVTSALNAVGVTTREMMSILQEMKSVGALQAELIIK
jgi:flagellar P-ring protein precursor FlgI